MAFQYNGGFTNKHNLDRNNYLNMRIMKFICHIVQVIKNTMLKWKQKDESTYEITA
jgi:hypothetical protein